MFWFWKEHVVGGSSLKSTIKETNIWTVTSVDKCGGCSFSRCNGQNKTSPNSCKLQGKQLSHYKRLVTTVGPCFCMFLYQRIRFGSNYRDNCSEIAQFIPHLHFLLPELSKFSSVNQWLWAMPGCHFLRPSAMSPVPGHPWLASSKGRPSLSALCGLETQGHRIQPFHGYTTWCRPHS